MDGTATWGRERLGGLLLAAAPLALALLVARAAAAASPQRLGALDGDLAGLPNGRRLGDDIVDIDLRAFAQGYGSFLAGALGLPDLSPNNQLGDGVDGNDVPLLPTFPYVGTPHQGYEVP